jgi:hypothetical protein
MRVVLVHVHTKTKFEGEKYSFNSALDEIV